MIFYTLSIVDVHLCMCLCLLCYCSVGRNLALTWSTWRLVSAWTARWLWTASRAVKCWWSAHANCQHTLRDGRCLSRDPSSLASPHLSELSWSQRWIKRQRKRVCTSRRGYICVLLFCYVHSLCLFRTPQVWWDCRTSWLTKMTSLLSLY